MATMTQLKVGFHADILIMVLGKNPERTFSQLMLMDLILDEPEKQD